MLIQCYAGSTSQKRKRETSINNLLELCCELEAYGFEINLYEICIVNKIMNGEQMIVTYHVRDLQTSCKNYILITKFIMYLADIYDQTITKR